jgi:3',5'-cyclic AMP phosphodiesterase CpdA
MQRLIAFLWAALALSAAGPFIAEPYLQLGPVRRAGSTDTLALVWHTAPDSAAWSVEVKNGANWVKTAAPAKREIAVRGAEPHLVWTATLAGLAPGSEFDYRVLRAGEEVFAARGKARKGTGQPVRFAAFGDAGVGGTAQQAVARQALAQNPDFVFMPGDLVYQRGRIAEYREKFFPIYNTNEVPLLRSTLFVAAPGNHDTGVRDLGSAADTLAYFYYWSQPLNGPVHPSFGILQGPAADQDAFRRAAGENFPRMGNFSFDYGDSHWLVLDSNRYAEWSDPALVEWIAKDLAATSATWKFAGFHHPGLHSSRAHAEDQWMRRLSGVLEAGGVDLVLAGHVHNYQRSRPLTFRAAGGQDGDRVPGTWTLDTDYDGGSKTRPKGVIYLVTGAGGAGLYDPVQNDNPSTWQEFTVKFKSSTPSLTVGEIEGRVARFRQVSAAGDLLDAFTITK